MVSYPLILKWDSFAHTFVSRHVTAHRPGTQDTSICYHHCFIFIVSWTHWRLKSWGMASHQTLSLWTGRRRARCTGLSLWYLQYSSACNHGLGQSVQTCRGRAPQEQNIDFETVCLPSGFWIPPACIITLGHTTALTHNKRFWESLQLSLREEEANFTYLIQNIQH